MTSLPADPVPPAAPKDGPTIWRADDVLWARLAPLLVVVKPGKKPSRPRTDDRPLFEGVIWVLRTGAQWSACPVSSDPSPPYMIASKNGCGRGRSPAPGPSS